MLPRATAAALLAASLCVTGAAHADAPAPAAPAPAAPAPAAPAPAAPAPAAPAPAAPAPPAAQAHGALVVAVGDGSAAAAHALAFDVYRDPALRPSIDDATARVLAGDPPAADASPRLKEIGDLRATAAKTDPPLVQRRLLASLGSELGAPLVVTVTLDGGRPIARVLRSAGAVAERVELGATVETAADGAKTFRWPGATATLRGLLGVPDLVPPGPLRPLAPKAPAEPPSRPFYKNPWFWGTAGVMAAAGLTVLILSRTTAGASDVHLTGRVGP